MAEIGTDHGTVLPKEASALVVDQTGKLNFYMADGPDDKDMPQMVRLLAAVIIRSDDPEWVTEMITSLDEFDRT